MLVVALVANLLMTQPSLQPHAPDYAQASAWICRPDRQDACAIDLATGGGLEPRDSSTSPPLKSAPNIDCFYVYPTISTAEGDNAPIEVGEDELRVVALQLARFRSVCRLYAPLYRQLTVSDMKRRLEGGTTPDLAKAMAMAEADVTAAWAYYLEHDNQGRGLVLIGHSQGALILQNLIRDQIDTKPLQARLVAAILPGSFVTAPKGTDVGGTFTSIPACRTQGQIGCVIAFNSFLDAAGPPPAYRAALEDNERAICTNPANLSGGPSLLRTIHSADRATIIPWFSAATKPQADPPAPFIETRSLYGQCLDGEGAAYLSITDPDGYLAGFGDFVFGGERDAGMGLHLIDLELVLGDLIERLGEQAEAFTASTDLRPGVWPAAPE